jgi:hypothetical protein
LNVKAFSLDRTVEDVGHDARLVGWPWVEGTHSWVEPTSMAVLALRRQGLADRGHVVDGVRLLEDRAIDTGGWNYGNKEVLGATLRPRPMSTGIALLALAGFEPDRTIIERGVAYLERELPRTRSPNSMGWGLLGLAAWRRRPTGAETWLAESFARASRQSASALLIACVMLGASWKGPDLFGVVPRSFGESAKTSSAAAGHKERQP